MGFEFGEATPYARLLDKLWLEATVLSARKKDDLA
jgi:hypothetical protein